MTRWLFMAAMMVPGPTLAPPPGITPIGELGSDETTQHVEVLRIRRDFGHPSVDVVLDAWMPSDPETAPRIDDLRLWWSDEVDRYPFSERTRGYVQVALDRLEIDRWRLNVSRRGRHRALTFDVRLHQGRPAAFADVLLADGRKVSDCRAHHAILHGRRLFGTLIGLGSVEVTCTDASGQLHRGELRRLGCEGRGC